MSRYRTMSIGSKDIETLMIVSLDDRVALTLCNVLLKRCRNEDVLIFHSILEAPLPVLRRRGYNVDRILNQQKIERVARIADLERQAEAEKELRVEQQALQATSDVKESAEVGSVGDPRESSDNLSIVSRPSDETSIRSPGIMNQLKARFRPQIGQMGSTPSVPQPAPASNEVSVCQSPAADQVSSFTELQPFRSHLCRPSRTAL
jgi:hypothetical protein